MDMVGVSVHNVRANNHFIKTLLTISIVINNISDISYLRIKLLYNILEQF